MTPYKRLMESPAVKRATKAELQKQYVSLNPAKLKRSIDAKLKLLYKAHQNKNGLPVEASHVSKKINHAYGVKIYHSIDTVSVS